MAPNNESLAAGGGMQTPTLILDRMPQQTRIQSLNDDWTGQSNQSERKRRQNRINQRAYRKRKEAQVQSSSVQHVSPISYPFKATWQPSDEDGNIAQGAKRQDRPIDLNPQDNGLWQLFNSAITSSYPRVSELSQVAVICRLEDDKSDKIIEEFQKWVTRNHLMGSPTADHVLVLIKFNIFRALSNNSLILGFPIELTMEDDALSPFTPLSEDEDRLKRPEILSKLPAALRPTVLQSQVPHHPWIDLLPVPRMRDNLILAENTYDEYFLCESLCGLINSPNSTTGFIIWGDPWDTAGWEVTPHLLQKWAWILEGCTELKKSTNYWRQRRGERPLNFERGFNEMVTEIP
ncbi:hypothetical protein EG329_001215 [Mollisiaceae sp. DMI_Dod_QoI]|nr:hypothetical protein EG329_001215 [Helotiales sp. DMI_Dod_QoI]